MATKRIKIYLVLSIIFYVLLAIYLWYSFSSIRSNQFESAANSASIINSRIDSAYSIDYSFSSDYFKDKVADVFKTFKQLKGVILTMDTGRLEYMMLTDGRILGNEYINGFDPDILIPDIVPVHPFMKVYKTRLYFTDGQSVNSFIVFDLLNRNLFFPVLRNALLAALIFLAISVLILSLQNNSTPVSENDGEFQPEEPVLSDKLPEIDVQLPDNIQVDDNPINRTAENLPSGMYSERSGLVWAHFLHEKLDAELKRAASFDQDSCLAFISITSPSGYIPYRNIAELIINHFKYKDLAFESGDNNFCVIIPEKDIDEGQIEVEKFKKSLLARFPDSSYRIHAGITSRNSRLLSEKRMIQEAKAALNKAEEEKDSTTIAFRTDLNKYREYIASKI